MVKIRMLQTFRGRETNERMIERGEYDTATDEMLNALVQYLVSHGFAVVIPEEQQPTVEREEQKTVDAGIDIESMTKKEVIALLEEAGVDVDIRATVGTLKEIARGLFS